MNTHKYSEDRINKIIKLLTDVATLKRNGSPLYMNQLFVKHGVSPFAQSLIPHDVEKSTITREYAIKVLDQISLRIKETRERRETQRHMRCNDVLHTTPKKEEDNVLTDYTDDRRISLCIEFLKNNGYKILAPKTEYVEV